jgi:hypothetical protein
VYLTGKSSHDIVKASSSLLLGKVGKYMEYVYFPDGKKVAMDIIISIATKTGKTVADVLNGMTGKNPTEKTSLECAIEGAKEHQEYLGIHGRRNVYSFSNTHYNKMGVKCRRSPKYSVGHVHEYHIPVTSPEWQAFRAGKISATVALTQYKARTFVPKTVSFTTKDGKVVSFTTKK